jgi:peptide deformylase
VKIVHYPHPALRHPARPLPAIDGEVLRRAAEMLDLMYQARGVGLAAPQVAWSVQLFVMNPSADPEQKDQERVLINPVVVDKKGIIEGEEGCLSFPGLHQTIRRSRSVVVHGYDLQGRAVEVHSTTDFESRILQHEFDHLHGILFIDKMGPLARLGSRGSLKELEQKYREAQERGEIPSDAELKKSLENPELLA